ncbi:MAG: hypothetical protein KTR32_42610 [Granulosicoccus sp.]|nr:hypothetical protein [Granulosicoccus sp.]
MALPLLPLLKIVALGSVKIIFLLLGSIFFPVYALRLILTGASGLLLPVLDWLESKERLDSARHQAIVEDLSTLSEVEFSRREARHLLLGLTSKTISNMGQAIVGIPQSIVGFLRQLFGKSG